MSKAGSQGVPGLGSLAGYAMSDSDDEADVKPALSGNISGSDDENSSHSQAPSRNYSPVIVEDESLEKKKLAVSSLGLVSYGGHDEDDSDMDTKNSDVEEENNSVTSTDAHRNGEGVVDYEKTLTAEDLTNIGDTEQNAVVSDSNISDVVIPPSPPGSPPPSLMNKIRSMCRRGQGSLDDAIQNRKDFRNPSIYEKLLSHVGVDEKGTNYPPELFDPSIWDKSSYYDELAKLQNIEMEKRKADKKDRVKVDFITATKSTASTDSGDATANKKSKWDSGTQQGAQATTISTAPPVGSLIKKK